MPVRLGVLGALVALVLSSMPLATTAVADPLQRPRQPKASAAGQAPDRHAGRAARAEAALERARALFASPSGAPDGRARGRSVTGPVPHASLVMHDLAVGLDTLPPRDQRVARAILARPTDSVEEPLPGIGYGDAKTDTTCDGPRTGGPDVCLHWVADPSSRHAPRSEDLDGDGVPDWVTTTAGVLDEVWQRLVVELGYEAPLPDGGLPDAGPDDRTDVYLADLGEFGVYGYCVPEWTGGSTSPAYCVLDNDYAPEQYFADPLELLQVSAAHEFFHAVQVGYAVSAPHWVMEGTAAWVEDEVYDDVDDNLQYLTHSPLAKPRRSLDTTGSSTTWLYGSWVFWRFLTEYFSERGTTAPDIVRHVWERMALGQGALPAMRAEVQRRGVPFATLFGHFGALNRVAPRWYDEGHLYAPFVAPVLAVDRFTLSTGRRSTAWRARTLARLSGRHLTVRPGAGMGGAWRLQVSLDLPPTRRGSRANVMVHRRDGAVDWSAARLDRAGDGTLVVPFDRRRIALVAVTLTNAGTGGAGTFRLRARAVR